MHAKLRRETGSKLRVHVCGCVTSLTSLTEAGDVQYAHVAATGAERQRLVDARHDVVEETRVDRLAERVTCARRLANLQRHPAPQTHTHTQ